MGVQPTPSSSPTQRIAEVVAEAEGVDPVALDPPLFDVVDGDTLDGLIRSNERKEEEATLSVTFQYQGYTVRIAAGGSVSLER